MSQRTLLNEETERAKTAFFGVLDEIEIAKAGVREVRETLMQESAAVARGNVDGAGDGDGGVLATFNGELMVYWSMYY